MAGDRLSLHSILVDLLGTTNQTHTRVYFQPPPTINLQYPCIVYKRSDLRTFFSGNEPYLGLKKYLITVIDKDPDSLIPDKVAKLPYSSSSSHFASDGLNHDVYTLYF